MSSRSLALVFLSFATIAYANDSALNEGHRGPEPLGLSEAQESPIQMVSEHLVFQMGREATRVRAMFTFRNTDTASTVSQLVGFPDPGLAARERGGKYNLLLNTSGPLKELQTSINGRLTSSALRYGEILDEGDGYWKPVEEGRGSSSMA